MKKYAVLYNPLSGNGSGRSDAARMSALLTDGETEFVDLTCLTDWRAFFAGRPDSEIVLCGGDGTLNAFVNAVDGIDYPNRVRYFATGSGNDFLGDIGGKKGDFPPDITACLRDLPVVVVQGKEYKFINGVSLGLDGYCCEKGDRIRAAHRGSRPVRIHYTLIALKGILFAYRPADCTVTVDGEEFTYRRVWLAPTMNGRYYGGGMMIAPTQDRLNAGRHVTFVAAHDLSRALILTLFPSIFGGKHLRYTKRVSVHTGHRVTVRFARPCAFQIDGEPISDVTEYTVLAGPAKADARPEPADL